MTADRDNGLVPVLITFRPGLIWLSPGAESLFLYCTLTAPVGLPPEPALVVAVTAPEAAETLPAASFARTV